MGEEKFSSNGPGRKTNMADMLIYGKNFDLDLFFAKVKFPPLCYCMGKKVEQRIFLKL